MENIEIIQAITTIFKGADEHNWSKIENILTPNVLMDYTSFFGGEPSIQTPKQITDSWAGFLPGFDETNHQLFDFQVTVNNDLATVNNAIKGDHFIDNENWIVEGTYDCELVKTNNKWLVSKIKFNFASQSGNLGLLAIATERMKK
jgi:SnoaL-like domain